MTSNQSKTSLFERKIHAEIKIANGLFGGRMTQMWRAALRPAGTMTTDHSECLLELEPSENSNRRKVSRNACTFLTYRPVYVFVLLEETCSLLNVFGESTKGAIRLSNVTRRAVRRSKE